MVDQSNCKEEYIKAMHLGQKEFRELTAAGRDPHPAALEELLPELSRCAVTELPVQEIPIDRIAGMRSAGRVSAFSAGFYPLLAEDSEFAAKWIRLCEAHLSDTGIRDPIDCLEYMGSFYVQEGNKRLSVLKYFGAARIPCRIRRVTPEKNAPGAGLYAEFLEFHKLSGLYDIQFRKPGDYARLLAALGRERDRVWTEEERRRFLSRYHAFHEAFDSLSGNRKALCPEEALLLWLQVHPWEQLGDLPARELRQSLAALWRDVQTASGQEIKMQTAPEEAEKKGLLDKLISPAPKHLIVAFLYHQNAAVSPWTRAHAEGVREMSRALGDAVTVREYGHADSPEAAEELLARAVEDGAEMVFTTTPPLLRPTLKAAVKYPRVRFLNCSACQPLSSVRSYYCRTYEGKFITGLIAGAMAENDLIGYIGSYPILGVPASVNAFALGARMANPRARILLEWSCLPGDSVQALRDRGARVISNRDVPLRERQYMEQGRFGTFLIDDTGAITPVASPCWMWGRLYERLVRSVLAGGWVKKDPPEAVNYWLGMDSGVIDVEMTEAVPQGVRLLAETMTAQLRAGTLDPFRQALRSQDGTLISDGSRSLSSMELLQMDWLCQGVEGRLPEYEELLPMSRSLVRELGVHRDSIPPEKPDGVPGRGE